MNLGRRCLTIAALGSLAVLVLADDWPQWRGPNRDGISSETGFEKRWSEPPPKLWEEPIGSAYSGLICVDGRVYTSGTRDGHQVLFCLDANSGKLLWQTPYEEEFKNNWGDGSRATPVFSDGRVYVIGGQGRLACVAADTGKIVWDRRFSAPPKWGYSGSVLIEGRLALTVAGGDLGALIALDKQTGEIVWQCGTGIVGYATPQPFTFDGRRYVVAFLGKEALIAELETGRQVWSMPWETDWDVNASTPIFHDGHLLLSSGYKHGSILLRLKRVGDALATETVWQNKHIRAKFQTPVLYDGHLYISDEVGFKCVAFATGEERWHERNVKHGPLVIADGHIIQLTEDGRLRIGPASPKGFEALTDVAVLDGRCWTVPTLSGGRLFVRNLERAAGFKLTR